MKNFLAIILTAALLAVSGCHKYNDSQVWDTLFDLTIEQQKQAARLVALEAWQTAVNDNISALHSLVGALESNDYVTAVTPFADPAPGGYHVDFTKSDRATIWNGATGDPGATPDIGAAQYPEHSGTYYWTLDGDWLLDDNDEKIAVTGQTGDTGADGVTPKLRINAGDNYWEVCTNGVCSEDADWQQVLDSEGDPVLATGAQGDAIFAANGIDNTLDDYVIFTLADATTTIQVPKYRPLGIDIEPYGAFANGTPTEVAFTYTGEVKSITAVDVPRGWTVAAALAAASSAGTLTVTAPAADGPAYTAAGSATLIISDRKERTITALLALDCPPYVAPVALGISFEQPEALFDKNETRNVAFTTSGNATAVKALDVPTGWSVQVEFAASNPAGTFTITAPATWTSGEAVIIVYDADGNAKMRTLTLPAPPTFAASTQSWTFSGSTLVWSDAIQVPNCNKADMVSSTSQADCRSANTAGNYWYYYNMPYVVDNANTLCQNPWHVPSLEDATPLFNPDIAADVCAAFIVGDERVIGQAVGMGTEWGLNTLDHVGNRSVFQLSMSLSRVAAAFYTRDAAVKIMCVKPLETN
jgi:hypothetical protein